MNEDTMRQLQGLFERPERDETPTLPRDMLELLNRPEPKEDELPEIPEDLRAPLA